jgi:hypothetical protein
MVDWTAIGMREGPHLEAAAAPLVHRGRLCIQVCSFTLPDYELLDGVYIMVVTARPPDAGLPAGEREGLLGPVEEDRPVRARRLVAGAPKADGPQILGLGR